MQLKISRKIRRIVNKKWNRGTEGITSRFLSILCHEGNRSPSCANDSASLSFVPLFVLVSPWIVTCTVSVYQEMRVPFSVCARESFRSYQILSPPLPCLSLLLPPPSPRPFREKLESPDFTTRLLFLLSRVVFEKKRK